MALIDRARNVLNHLDAEGFGDEDRQNRPLVFVCHSFGGLVAKQMLEIAQESPTPEWNRIFHRTKGVVFLSTPNSGAILADYVKYVAEELQNAPIGDLTSITVEELSHASPHLLKLNRWYINQAPANGIATLPFCEKRKTYGFLVVDEASADPSIQGVDVRPLDEDHLTICKPLDREYPVYKLTLRFLRNSMSKPRPIEMPDPINDPVAEGGCPNPPKKEVVEAAEAEDRNVKPEDVTLHYQNRTNKKLKLALFDWSRAYAGWNSTWRFIDMDPTGEVGTYEDFVTEKEDGDEGADISSGWFSVYAVAPDTLDPRCLLTTNLFADPEPLLVIEERADGLVASLETAGPE